jgi:hypothetical protein
VRGDVRSFQVALVADSLLEALLPLLAEEGWGTIQLPPAGLDVETAAAWLEQVAEHVAEFVRNDYAVVLLGDGSYQDELAALGLPSLAAGEEPSAFLRQYAIQPPSTSKLTPET